MAALKAVVRSGRLILDEATDLPEGAEVELAVVRDHDEDPELFEELRASAEGEAKGHILKLLSDGEVASVSSAETKADLRKGDEYLDLEQLHHGVQRAHGAVTPMGHVLPRKAIHEDTWRRVLRQLKAAP